MTQKKKKSSQQGDFFATDNLDNDGMDRDIAHHLNKIHHCMWKVNK